MKTRRQLATSLIKGLDVLSVVAHHPEGVTVQQIVPSLHIPRTSILRILDTLKQYGLIEHVGRNYRTAASFYDWTTPHFHRVLQVRYRSCLEAVAQQVNELAMLGILEGNKLSHIDYVEGTHAMRIAPKPSQAHALETSAMGKLYLTQRPDLAKRIRTPRLLAEIGEAKKTGIAWNREESDAGLVAVATWAATPSPQAPTISVSWPASRFSPEAAELAFSVIRKHLPDTKEPS